MVTRIKASNIESGAVTTDKFAAGAVTAEKIDAGAAAGPRISSIDYPGDDTAAVPAGGQTVIINGSGFVSGCSVFLNETVVTTVGFVSATQLQITAPARSTGTYLLYVVNPDGGTAISVPGMVYSGTPTWTTASGSLGTPYETAAVSINLAATGDGSLTYAVTSGSSLPAGLTLTSGGLLSGTVPATAADTTYNFELDVIDSENQSTTRQFSITYKVDVVTWSSPAAGASFAWTEGQADSTSLAATSAAGKSISFSVQAGSLPANVTIAGNLISGTPSTTQANTAVTLRAAAADTARFADQILYFTVAASERALFASGWISSGRASSIDTVNISTTGNATDWGGTINNARNGLAGCSSSTRGIFSGGQMSSGFQAYIDYTSGFASTGSTSSFGSLSVYARAYHGSCSSSTRGIFGGGATPTSGAAVSNIEYITIASLGNGTTFGALTTVRRGLAACSSSTRGIFGGGSNSSGDRITSSNIQYVTIASTGNATTFGNLTVARGESSAGSIASCSSSTRGLFAGGVNNVGSMQSVIDYVTIASTGNATNFGALTSALGWLAGASSSTRGVFAGGGITQTDYRTTIQYVTIASTGNATTFGDLTVGRQSLGACSNSHGGL